MTSWRRFGMPTGRTLTPEQRLQAPQIRLQRFLVELGDVLVVAGIGVTDAINTLRQVSIAMGAPDAEIIAFPTALVVSVPGAVEDRGDEHIAVAATGATTTLRFDQLAALFALADLAKRAAINPDKGLRRLDAIRMMPPRFPALLRVAGHGAAAAGVCLLLQPSWRDLVIAFLMACWSEPGFWCASP